MDSRTFDLRRLDLLTKEHALAILRARRHGPVTLLVEPDTHPARKLAQYRLGRVVEAGEGVLRLAV